MGALWHFTLIFIGYNLSKNYIFLSMNSYVGIYEIGYIKESIK